MLLLVMKNLTRRTCCVFLVKRLIVSKSVKSMALIGCLSSVGSVARTLFGIAGISAIFANPATIMYLLSPISLESTKKNSKITLNVEISEIE